MGPYTHPMARRKRGGKKKKKTSPVILENTFLEEYNSSKIKRIAVAVAISYAVMFTAFIIVIGLLYAIWSVGDDIPQAVVYIVPIIIMGIASVGVLFIYYKATELPIMEVTAPQPQDVVALACAGIEAMGYEPVLAGNTETQTSLKLGKDGPRLNVIPQGNDRYKLTLQDINFIKPERVLYFRLLTKRLTDQCANPPEWVQTRK